MAARAPLRVAAKRAAHHFFSMRYRCVYVRTNSDLPAMAGVDADAVGELVRRHDLQLAVGGQHDALAVVVEAVQVAVGQHGRRGVAAGERVRLDELAGLGLEAGDDAGVVEHEQQVARDRPARAATARPWA